MSFLAVDPAGFPVLSPCLAEQANQSLSICNDGGDLRPSYGGPAGSNRAAIVATFRSQYAHGNFALERVCRYISRLLLGHSLGAFPAPGGTRSSASHCAPLRRLGSSQNKFENHGNERLSNFFRALPESRPSALGSRAHSLSSAQCDPSNNGRIQQPETLSCTYQLCGIGAVLVSAICHAAPGLQVPGAMDVTMSWLPTSGPEGAPVGKSRRGEEPSEIQPTHQ